MTVKTEQMGKITASTIPMRKRQTASPAKLCVAAVHSMRMAHIKQHVAMNLPFGNLWIRKAEGYSAIRYPKYCVTISNAPFTAADSSWRVTYENGADP